MSYSALGWDDGNREGIQAKDQRPRRGKSVGELERIVRDLAALASQVAFCAHCRHEVGRSGADHAPGCPYRRAVEWVKENPA